jgi:hypothetical protein
MNKLGSGLLLRNFRKHQDRHPDFTGNDIAFQCPQCLAHNTVAIAAWEKSGRRGMFFSLAISTPRAQAPPQPDPDPERKAEQPESPPVPGEDNIPY